MELLIYIFIFLFGLSVGSFLNTVIWRLHSGRSVWRGRSECNECKHKLNFLDLVPVLSFLIIKGRCRYCGKPISWQYPVVELCAAVLFCAVYAVLIANFSAYGGSAASNAAGTFDGAALGGKFLITLFLHWFYTAALLVIFVYDLKYGLILDKVVLPALFFAIAGNLFLDVSIAKMFLAAFIGGGFFLAQFLVSKGKWLGGGDVWLGALMGLVLSYPNILAALFLAYVFGASVGIILIISGVLNWKSRIPFGTFLTAAAFITLLYGNEILGWYLKLLL